MAFAPILVALSLSSLVVLGCAENEGSKLGPPAIAATSSGAGSGGDPGFTSGAGGACQSESACGAEVHTIAFDAPNLYFVLDASGSMLEVPKGEDETRFVLVRKKAILLVQELGPLANIGAALFPYGNVAKDPCSTGQEVMPVTPGDPFTGDGSEGPTTTAFRAATKVTPLGGTPVSTTLTALLPKLSVLSGRTILVLLTDGGPNCNPKAVCASDECMPVIYGQCEPADGCCDPDSKQGGPALCVDSTATVAAIEAIHLLGIDVHVVGLPADMLTLFGGVLDAMAVAGGVPQLGDTKYISPNDLDELGPALAKLAADALNCTITLAKPPAEQGLTNVYFGCDVVTHDTMNGWSWTSPDTITLNGEACIALKSGTVHEVKIITGCPTEKPK
ncbi:MAG: VWA domain-containing protein [Myxococcales bacterium]|nr:VWA domain-containing protein [Myxococcales bacterium]